MQDRQDRPWLSRGSHRTPGEGMCVMELASMIADERFTDRPRCVDPAIGAYLRAFNDRLGHADRQRLVPYAPRCVGTVRDGRRVRRARRDLCLEFAGVRVLGRGWAARRLALAATRFRVAVLIGVRPAMSSCAAGGELAARAAFDRRRDEAGGFGLLDALLAEGASPPAALAPDRALSATAS